MGTDTEAVLLALEKTPVSLHCWQGDDVNGTERPDAVLTGGIQTMGNYSGKASSADELRSDLDQAFALIPGKHRLNLHASYAELDGRKVERTDYTAAHFQDWIDWCKLRGLGLDFNPPISHIRSPTMA